MPWWDPAWHHRVEMRVSTGALARQDQPMDVEINLGGLLAGAGVASALDTNSPRLVEHDAAGIAIGETASWVFHDGVTGMDTLFFALGGATPAGTQRYYSLYFDVVANGPKLAPFYWLDVSMSSVQAGPLILDGIDSTDFSIAYIRRVGDLNNWMGRRTKLHFNGLSADYSQSVEDAAQLYTPGQVTTLRLADPGGLYVMESVSGAGAATVREFFMLTTQTWMETLTHVENPSANTLGAVAFYLDHDFDIGDMAGDDTANYDAANDVLYGTDPVTMPTTYFGVAGPASTAVMVDAFASVHSGVRANFLSGASSSAGDVGMAFKYALPNVAPSSVVSLRTLEGLGDSPADLVAIKAAWLVQRPNVTVGPLVTQ